jgi:hypothetical protein
VSGQTSSWPDAIVSIGGFLKVSEIVRDPDHRTRISGDDHDRKRAEDGVDCSALKAKLT